MIPQTDPTPSSPQKSETQESPCNASEVQEPMHQRILLPIDFSEHSKITVSYARRIALINNSTVYLLHVFQLPDYVVAPYPSQSHNSPEVQTDFDAAEMDADERLRAAAQELSECGVKTTPILRVGYPLEEIILMANHYDVDLIVIGSHGRSRFARLLLGSTAERVVEHAHCNVLVVRES
jgi:nucleotide-binding universal stress UspA family protein